MPNVIIADDEPFVRNFLKILIKSMKFELVDEVASGDKLVDSMIKHHPNILLLDLNMPNINGRVFLEEFSHMFPKTCIIILTTSPLANIKDLDTIKNVHCFINKNTPVEQIAKGIHESWEWFQQNNDL